MSAASAFSTDALAWLTLGMTAAFFCGFRPFAVALCLGLAGAYGWVQLPAGLLLSAPLAIALCAILATAERWVDGRALHGHPEDLLLSALRVPCGASLLAVICVELWGAWGWLAMPLGAALALSGQSLKAALRSLGTLLGWRRTLVALAVGVDLAVPSVLTLAWQQPGPAMLLLAVLLLVALPTAVWWVRELRSRWRRWAMLLEQT